ncbi:MAG: HDIG domain-containing protein [bacterium]|nr:HDIG domain-containing protein [bacterium]
MMRSGKRRIHYSGLLNRDPRRRATRKFRFSRVRGEDILRAGLLLVLVGMLTALFPATRQSYEYGAFRQGSIAPEEVIAPETFKVLKNKPEYTSEVETAQSEIPPVVVFAPHLPEERDRSLRLFFQDFTRTSTTAPDSVLFRLRQAHPEIGPVSESSLRYLLDRAATDRKTLNQMHSTIRGLLAEIYNTGVIADKSLIARGGATEVLLLKNESEQRASMADIRDLEEFTLSLQEEIAHLLPRSTTVEIKAVYELVVAYVMPNLTYNSPDTERRRAEAAQNISRYKGTVLKGERIVDKHDRITSDHIDQLASLVTHMNQRRQEDPYFPIIQAFARAIITSLLIAILFGFLQTSRPIIYRRTSNIVLFGILILMPALVASYAATMPSITPFLIPVALSVMLATVLFDAEIGLVVSLVCAILCASILGSLQHALVFIITGIAGAYSVHQVHQRSDFFRSIFYLIAAYTLTIAASGVLWLNYSTVAEFFDKVKWDLVFGIFTACASAVLTIGLLPIFESIFNVVTTITLLELSDLNRPLLRNLAIRAPGTYSHSIVMASLSEAAADAIGADRLLVRVGCYYHDIGKMIRPHYFIENQKGINPHDELQPRMSALILISHVKEGVELAEEEGLPRVLIDLIPQHHGTSEIASFKHRALERGDKQTVRDEDFRYPGPKPQTKEAGIINVADAVESATRTLSGNSPDQIKGMVQTIVKGRFTAGELDECDLTLRDLTKIQQAFLPILQAARHARVPYPWQQEQKREPRKEKKERL